MASIQKAIARAEESVSVSLPRWAWAQVEECVRAAERRERSTAQRSRYPYTKLQHKQRADRLLELAEGIRIGRRENG